MLSYTNEKKRLEELRSYDILDTLNEKDYDDITLMASIICNVPIALISFVDSERQWFKSKVGVDIEETKREHSFCSHAINFNEPFIVEDSRLDERFKNNPYVTGNPKIVFYAGIPLITAKGSNLGTICVIDDKPRQLDEKQLKALGILSDQVINLLNLRQINSDLNLVKRSLELKNKKLTADGKSMGNSLDKHIADHVKEIALQNIELDRINKELLAFNYISSHDLQEPLRKIQTFASMIKKEEREKMDGKAQEYLGKINSAAVRMSSLLKDLLSYSRATFTEKNFVSTSLSEIFEAIKVDFEDEILEKKAIVKLDCSIDRITVIPFQFRQLIYNLISNSLKFARKDVAAQITIKCDSVAGTEIPELLRENLNYTRVSITDNGIGFDNKYKEKIFEIFQRLDKEGIHSGTGIGLAIVKRIIDNHEGFIRAFSEEQVETVFEIFIPNNLGAKA